MDISQDKKMIERITKKEDPDKKKPKKKLHQIFEVKKPIIKKKLKKTKKPSNSY